MVPATRRIRTGQQEATHRTVCVAGPYLLTIYDELIAIQDRTGRQRREIRSGVRLTVELGPLNLAFAISGSSEAFCSAVPNFIITVPIHS